MSEKFSSRTKNYEINKQKDRWWKVARVFSRRTAGPVLSAFGMLNIWRYHQKVSAYFCQWIGIYNLQKYRGILVVNIWPVVSNTTRPTLVFSGWRWPHRSLHILNWQQANNIRGMVWPAQSPDVNIIEHGSPLIENT